ncbi:MAG: hypothetical protein ACXWM7_05155 [Parachlamydiaceae bacterium]
MKKNRTIGFIKWFNLNKGYGIIESEDGKRYFASLEDFKQANNVSSDIDIASLKVSFIEDDVQNFKDIPRAHKVELYD